MNKKCGYIRTIVAAVVISSVAAVGCGDKTEYYDKAEQYLSGGEYSLAIENYNKAIMEDEFLQESYRGAGIAYMKTADYEKAQEMFLRALKESDGTIGDMEMDLSYYLGETQTCLGNYQDAIETYSNVLEVYDKEQDAYFYRGSAYLQLGKNEKAEKDFEKAAGKGDMRILYGIYEAYVLKGSDAGVSYLDKIVKAKGDSPEELYIKGKAYYQLGDVEQAVATLKQSGEKKESQAWFYLGYIYEQQGDFDSALEAYETYQKEAGLSFGEYQTVSACMQKAGKYEAALELNRSLREGAGKETVQNLLFEEILIYENCGEYSTAREKAESYVSEYPSDAQGQKEYQFLLTR